MTKENIAQEILSKQDVFLAIQEKKLAKKQLPVDTKEYYIYFNIRLPSFQVVLCAF